MFDAHQFAARLARQSDRWSPLRDFVAAWQSPLREGDGCSADELDAAEQRLGLPLPLALREWYLMAGRRDDVTGTQNFLVSPAQLEVNGDSGLLEFYSENQQVVLWGVNADDLRLPDPPVWLDNSGLYTSRQSVLRENSTLSEFVLQMVVLETIIAAPFSRGGWLGTNAALDGGGRFCALGFPDWHWPTAPTRFFGGRETLFLVSGQDEFWGAARSPEGFEALLKSLNVIAEE